MWVFGYGSLIWDPGFPVADRRIARLSGWQRSFCMWSVHHRGTPEAPGLVLALDRAAQGHCDGVALRVAPGAETETLHALRERELVSSAYLERVLPVALRGGEVVEALTFVIDPDHPQYCAALSLARQAEVIARSAGGRGKNRDYLFSTAAHLSGLGIADDDLAWLSARVREIGDVAEP